jgi:predicted negative regulator of RcsB-dependent stress response
MDKAVQQSADFYQLAAWFHANRQRVIAITSAVLVIAAIIGIYFWHKDYRETEANNALSNIKLPAPSREAQANPADAQPYVSVADEYAGTSAASRALLMAGGTYFNAGKFDQAQAQFGRFLAEYPDSPLANQASLGIAASLEAQGKVPEAAARYDDIIRRHPTDSIVPQAKSALARLDVAQNKPEEAMRLYEELAKTGNNDSWSAEASSQLSELLAKYPNLRKQPPAPAPAPSASTPVFSVPPSAQPAPAAPASPTSPNAPAKTAPVSTNK